MTRIDLPGGAFGQSDPSVCLCGGVGWFDVDLQHGISARPVMATWSGLFLCMCAVHESPDAIVELMGRL